MDPFLDTGALARLLAAGEATSRDLTRAALERAETLSHLAAFLHLDPDGAMESAAESDRRRSRGEARGPLDGVPLALKDNLVTRGLPTTCASRILAGWVPPYDGTAVSRLKTAGAVVLGKTNLDEFAMGSSTENSAFGPTRNPWDPERVPGGSSGGSAAAVAAGIVPLALGSETGGSVRQPAALCGVLGLKPTYGRISRSGLVAFASSLDQIGPISRDVEGMAWILGAIAGPDPLDSTSAPAAVPDYAAGLDGGVAGLRVGLPREYFAEGLDPATRARVETVAEALRDAGATLVDVSLPSSPLGIAAYYVIAPAEASSNLARFDGIRYGPRVRDPVDLEDLYVRTRSEGFGDEVKRRIVLGTFVLSAGYQEAYYLKAMAVRRAISADFDAAFSRVDVLLTPTTPGPAFPLGERAGDPLAMYLSDVYTVSVNLAGLPGISVPAGLVDGLPVGAQLIGRAFEEATLLRVAATLERALPWRGLRPTVAGGGGAA